MNIILAFLIAALILVAAPAIIFLATVLAGVALAVASALVIIAALIGAAVVARIVTAPAASARGFYATRDVEITPGGLVCLEPNEIIFMSDTKAYVGPCKVIFSDPRSPGRVTP